jgi:predicted transcriptional regulator
MRAELIVIETADEHREAQALIHSLMESREPHDVTRLRAQALLVADWEAKLYPTPPLDPIEAVKFRIDQLGLSAQDIAVLFGGHASEILSGKRRLSLAIIRRLHRALDIPLDVLFGSPDRGENMESPGEPAVPVQESIAPEYIVCLEDGKKLKALKRHLKAAHNMTPEEYAARWRLPPDYPMVAPNYAARRSEIANEIGLGRSRSRHGKAGLRGAAGG